MPINSFLFLALWEYLNVILMKSTKRIKSTCIDQKNINAFIKNINNVSQRSTDFMVIKLNWIYFYSIYLKEFSFNCYDQLKILLKQFHQMSLQKFPQLKKRIYKKQIKKIHRNYLLIFAMQFKKYKF